MENKTLVSICVISYNSSEFVLETLESAKRQSYEYIELIISDDGSEDHTVELCDQWLKNNGACFHSTELITVPKNTGIPANCNRAVKSAKGKWIKLIAADDILLENCVRDNLEYMQRNAETKILFSAMQPFVDENGKREFLEPVQLSQSFLDLDAGQQFIEIIFGKMEGVAPTLFIDKKVYLDLNYYDEAFKLAEDYPFWLKCTANQLRFASMIKLTVLYRLHSKSTAVAKTENGVMFQDRIKIFNQYLDRILDNENGKTQFSDYYKSNNHSFIKFCTVSENMELLRNVKKTNKISGLYYFLVRNYLLTFSKGDWLSRLVRSINYRILLRLE
ncbi:glycosyltransferase [Kaistella rhinocerotis]|uniref:glycosyltransferase n=1 Tax=Kaistella rhinocerotis TaxID=3026437 RepID=UPI002556094B|nr:glycosyltransferase [Kaistella sp. Ran72]